MYPSVLLNYVWLCLSFNNVSMYPLISPPIHPVSVLSRQLTRSGEVRLVQVISGLVGLDLSRLESVVLD